MTKTAIYTEVNRYLIESGQVADLDKVLSKWHTASDHNISGTLILVNLLAALREDMRTEANKASGKANIEKAMRAIIKSADPGRPMFHGAFENNGMQCVCDGCRVIRLYKPIDLPVPPVPCDMNVASLFENMHDSSREPLPLPTVAELKSIIKIKTAENRAIYGKNAKYHPLMYDWGEGKPAANAVYLLDILTAFPDARATIGRPVAPIYFIADMGDAILLPIRKREV